MGVHHCNVSGLGAMAECCVYCHTPGDLRPFGPNGAPICFNCMKADPEREAEAVRQFRAQLRAALEVSDVAVIGEAAGPRPYGGRRQ